MRLLTTPHALLFGLVLAGALVGAGVFFGLRGRGAATIAEEKTDAGISPPEAASEMLVRFGAPSPAPTSSVAPVPSPAQRAVTSAIEAQRADLVLRCWRPSLAKKAEPEHVSFVLHYAFAADGSQLGRGLVEEAPSRPDVTACVSAIPEITLPALGKPAAFDVHLTLP